MKARFRRLLVRVLVRVLVLPSVALPAFGGAESPDAPPPEAPSFGDSVTCRVTFRTDGTQAVFATWFPVGRHFSGLVGATRNDCVTFWSEDEIASGRRKTTQALGSRGGLLAFVRS